MERIKCVQRERERERRVAAFSWQFSAQNTCGQQGLMGFSFIVSFHAWPGEIFSKKKIKFNFKYVSSISLGLLYAYRSETELQLSYK